MPGDAILRRSSLVVAGASLPIPSHLGLASGGGDSSSANHPHGLGGGRSRAAAHALWPQPTSPSQAASLGTAAGGSAAALHGHSALGGRRLGLRSGHAPTGLGHLGCCAGEWLLLLLAGIPSGAHPRHPGQLPPPAGPSLAGRSLEAGGGGSPGARRSGAVGGRRADARRLQADEELAAHARSLGAHGGVPTRSPAGRGPTP